MKMKLLAIVLVLSAVFSSCATKPDPSWGPSPEPTLNSDGIKRVTDPGRFTQ